MHHGDVVLPLFNAGLVDADVAHLALTNSTSDEYTPTAAQLAGFATGFRG